MLNYNREEGKTILAAQGWVNELNVRASLTPTNAGTSNKPNPNDWDGKTGLKALTRRLQGKSVSYLYDQTSCVRVQNRQMSCARGSN